jgi:hypothetical protein
MASSNNFLSASVEDDDWCLTLGEGTSKLNKVTTASL